MAGAKSVANNAEKRKCQPSSNRMCGVELKLKLSCAASWFVVVAVVIVAIVVQWFAVMLCCCFFVLRGVMLLFARRIIPPPNDIIGNPPSLQLNYTKASLIFCPRLHGLNPVRTFVPPSSEQAAEEGGLSVQLDGWWLLACVCKQAATAHAPTTTSTGANSDKDSACGVAHATSRISLKYRNLMNKACENHAIIVRSFTGRVRQL